MLNIDDATRYRLYYKRIEEIRSVDSLTIFVATSAEKAYTAFFLIDRIHYSTLDVQCSMLDVHFFVDPIYETLH